MANDKVINKEIGKIKSKAKPLATGESQVPTTLVYIPGENGTVSGQTNFVYPDGTVVSLNGAGYGQTVAVVVLDQGQHNYGSS